MMVMMQWTNDRYPSNLYRVINKTSKDRYSIPYFFDGNPDFLERCFPGCEYPETGAKYAAVTVDNWMRGLHADAFGH